MTNVGYRLPFELTDSAKLLHFTILGGVRRPPVPPPLNDATAAELKLDIKCGKQVIAPGTIGAYAPHRMAVRLTADLRPSADGSAIRTSPVAGQLQAASVPTA